MNDGQPHDRWLSLTAAAERLGVHPTTLRRWADSGDITVMFTPGGHRRFLESDLDDFAAKRRSMVGHNQVAAEWADRALQTTRQEIVSRSGEPWLAAFDNGARDRNRRMGQKLLGLTMQYISASEADLPLLQEQAHTLAQDYGRMAWESGLPLTEALEATLFFRDLLVETALQMPENMPIKPEANVRLMRKINQLLNIIQLQIAEVYDESRPDILYRG
jgi:excisionase family DNA binding protein